jgi:sugar lactone lactonase YvrE
MQSGAMTSDIEHVVKVQNLLGECPVWDPRHMCLYWVDIEQSLFYRYHPETQDLLENELEIPIYALALDARHGLVAGSDEGFVFYDPDTNGYEYIAEVMAGEPGRRFNDGAVDRRGRFWAGTLDRERTPTNHLYRLNPDLSIHTMESGIIQSNGIDWSPDWRTMYLTDTRRRAIYAYDFDLELEKSETGASSSRPLKTRRKVCQTDWWSMQRVLSGALVFVVGSWCVTIPTVKRSGRCSFAGAASQQHGLRR